MYIIDSICKKKDINKNELSIIINIPEGIKAGPPCCILHILA